jgi:hypothetical protein
MGRYLFFVILDFLNYLSFIENITAYPVKPQSTTQMDSLGVPSHRHTVHGK